jgi:hypothetical protein
MLWPGAIGTLMIMVPVKYVLRIGRREENELEGDPTAKLGLLCCF